MLTYYCSKNKCKSSVANRDQAHIWYGEHGINKFLIFSLSFDCELVLYCLCLCAYYSLFLNGRRLILLLTQSKAQVLCLLLSH